jgi:hypothetical protein
LSRARQSRPKHAVPMTAFLEVEKQHTHSSVTALFLVLTTSARGFQTPVSSMGRF